MKYIIVSGGKVEDAFALDWIKNHSFERLIAADSGMDFFYRNGLIPDVIAGDFDSADAKSLDAFEQKGEIEILKLNPIKDDTDTEFVIREAIRRGATEITLLGATGTRLDHVFGNMHLLGIGLEEDVKIQMVDPHNRIRMIRNSLNIRKDEQFGDYVSLLPIDGTVTGVTLKGFRYPLQDAVLSSFSSLGISNEIVEDEAHIEIRDGVLLVMETRD